MAKPITFKIAPELLNHTFLPYLEAKEAIQLYCGNRGSGKTKFIQQKAIIYCLTKRYFRLVYVRKIADTIRKSIFQGFQDIIAEWHLKPYFHIKESEMTIRCKLNGNMLISYGLDNPEKLKGIKDPSHILCDEMTEIDFQDYAALVGLLRTEKVAQTQFWGTFNPEYGFWGREYFFEDSENDDIPLGIVPAKQKNTLILKASFKENPFINADKYEANLLDLAAGDENKLTVWIDGNWGQSQTGNEYFTKYKRSVHVGKVDYLPNKPIHTSFDFNSVPYMTMLACQIDIQETTLYIRVFKEYCLASPFNTTVDCCKALISDYGDSITDLLYYGDASGNSNIAGKGNVNAFDDVRMAFGSYITDSSKRTLRKNPSVLKRRDFMNNLLEGKVVYNDMTVCLLIDEGCKELQKDLLKTKLGTDGKIKKKVKDKITGVSYEELGHTSDALEYFIVELLKSEFYKK